MGLASVINNGVQTPFKLKSTLLGVSPISPQFQSRKCTRVHFHCHRAPPFFAVRHQHRAHYFPIACSRETQQEDDLSTSDSERTSPQSYNDINYADTSNTPTSLGDTPTSLGDQEGKAQGHENYTTSVTTVVLCVCTAVAFGVGLGLKDGVGKASEFFAGYLLEQSLSVDNLFVFVLIFKYFKVPLMYQNRVLSYGIAGAVFFRLSLILLGAATLQRFEAVNLFLAAILLYSSFKLFTDEEEDTDLSDNFIVKICQKVIPVTDNYDGNKFITIEDGVWKASTILGRPHLYFLQ